MKTLLISVSGLRGIVGDGLSPQVVLDYTLGYGSALGPGRQVVLSRDSRPSGEMLRGAATAGLLAVGCDVMDLGICATPTAAIQVRALGAAGGIQITASHNPPAWNGMKMFQPSGMVLNRDQGQLLLARYEARAAGLVDALHTGRVQVVDDPHQLHLDRVLGLVAVAAIRRRGFRVVLDACHGAGGPLGRRLLDALGCRVTLLGGSPDGAFEHPPEPLAEHLTGLGSAVGAEAADVGFAQDPDADRLAIVDETGRYIGEDYTLALAVDEVLRDRRGLVVTNLSTSRAIEDLASRHACPLVRTAVGEVNVAERMARDGAVIGGEGNGGIIDPRIGHVRDSFIGMALVLQAMARSGRPLGAIVQDLPQYTIVKDKFPIPPDGLEPVLDRLAAAHPEARPDRTDGLRLDWSRSWVHVRPSNTEPILRVIAEAPTGPDARALCREVASVIGP